MTTQQINIKDDEETIQKYIYDNGLKFSLTFNEQIENIDVQFIANAKIKARQRYIRKMETLKISELKLIYDLVDGYLFSRAGIILRTQYLIYICQLLYLKMPDKFSYFTNDRICLAMDFDTDKYKCINDVDVEDRYFNMTDIISNFQLIYSNFDDKLKLKLKPIYETMCHIEMDFIMFSDTMFKHRRLLNLINVNFIKVIETTDVETSMICKNKKMYNYRLKLRNNLYITDLKLPMFINTNNQFKMSHLKLISNESLFKCLILNGEIYLNNFWIYDDI